MRLTIMPLVGKYRVLNDCSVRLSPDKTKSLLGHKTGIQEDIMNPGFLRIPAGTVFHLSKVNSSSYRNQVRMSCPIKYNDRKNPWAGMWSDWGLNDFEDFTIDVEKLP